MHVHTLLRAAFKAQLPASAKDDARMTLNSIYSLAVDSPTLRWLCSNDRKLDEWVSNQVEVCMGAPCYDKEYDANYDVTCVCPVTGDGIHCAFAQEEDRADGHLCKEVSSDEASCAASTGGSEHANISHTWTEVQKYVDAILYANPDQGNSTQCPSNGVMNTKFEANSTDYVAALNSTGDAANATGVPAGGRR